MATSSTTRLPLEQLVQPLCFFLLGAAPVTPYRIGEGAGNH